MADIIEDENVDTTVTDKVIMKIFTLCDENKTEMVTVSKLIDFISPYIDYNILHLEELRSVLDPAKNDPSINYETFFNAMKEWTDKFKNVFQTANASSDMIEPTITKLSDYDARHSTPMKEKIVRCLSRTDYDAGILNLSNISSYSYSGSVGGVVDSTCLQEQINELQFQNRKLNSMLNDVRSQLNDTEEQNGALKSDLERISKRLQAEQKVNEHLQKERSENDEYRESTNNVIKKCETLSQKLLTYKKENANLQSTVENFQSQNHNLQETITKLRCNDSEKTSVVNELRIEIDIREKELSTLEECKRNLNAICKEKEEQVQNLIDETQHLKYEKKTLEKRLHDVLIRNTAQFVPVPDEPGKKSIPHCRKSTPIPFTPSHNTKFQFFNYDSPAFRLFENRATLHSPQLLRMLNNPISPIHSGTPMLRHKQFPHRHSERFYSAESDLNPNDILLNVSPNSELPVPLDGSFEHPNQYSTSIFNTSNPESYSSVDLQLEPTDNTRMSKSLSPSLSSDDDFYFRSTFNNFSPNPPHESLHSELVHASASGCIGSDFDCDHKLKMSQFEDEIESLTLALKQHDHCDELFSKLENELSNTKAKLAKYESMKTTQNDYETDKDTLTQLEEKLKAITTETELRIQKMKSLKDEVHADCDKKNIEIVNLKDKIVSLTEEIESCKQEIDGIHKKKESTKIKLKLILNDHTTLGEKYKLLESNLETVQNELEAKEVEKTELRNTNKDIAEELSIHKVNYSISQQQIANLNLDLTKTKKELIMTMSRLEDITKNYDTLQQRSKMAESKLEDLNRIKENMIAKEEYMKTQEELLKLKAETGKSKTTLEWKIKHIHSLQTEIEAITKENLEYENKLKNMDNLLIRNSTLEEELEEYIVKYKYAIEQLPVIEEMRENYKKTQQKLKEKETQFKTNKKKLKELNDKVKLMKISQDAEKIKWVQEHIELTNKINEMADEITEGQKKQEYLNTAIMELSEAGCQNCEKLQGELEELKGEAQLVKTQLKTLQDDDKRDTKVEPRKRRIEVLQYKLDKLDEQLEDEKNKTKLLTANLTSVTSEKSGLEVKIENVVKEQKHLTGQKEECQIRIKKLSHTIDALELKLQTYRQNINDLKCEVENKNKEVTLHQKRMYEVEDKSNKLHSEHISLIAHITFARQRMKDNRQILGSNTLETVNVWKATLETVTPGSPILKLLDATLFDVASFALGGPLDEEVNLLDQQIRFTSILLKTLAKFKETFFAIGTEELLTKPSELQRKSVSKQSLLATSLTKKFVLKPARLNFRSTDISMSPAAAASEMAAMVSHITKPFASDTELNNNDIPIKDTLKTIDKERKPFLSDGSDSSSSSDSGSSESLNARPTVLETNEVFRLAAGESKVEDEKTVKDGLTRQFRSMSEGTVVTHQLTAAGDVQVFPNLRDNVLETMGLLPDSESKDRMTAEDIEVKFQTLTLAFAIDAVTLADRRERQRRQRDQAEDNLNTEIERFANAIRRLHPLCIDAETTELVTSLLSQLDVIVQASSRISISTEVFGSVQQEWRLTESVNLMLSHLRNLRQQRDTARQQLQCTKRMLQESTCAVEPTSPGCRQRLTSANGRVVTRRRASIATIQRPGEPLLRSPGSSTAAALVDGMMPRRVTTRRTSAAVCGEASYRHWDSRHRLDWSPTDRASSIIRSTRPSRLELGLDLVKIREGTMESLSSFDENNSDTENVFQTPTTIVEQSFMDGLVPPTLRDKIRKKLHVWGELFQQYWNYLIAEGTIHEFCCIGAIICFAISTITLGNIMIEMEYARQGVIVQKIPWAWSTWTELCAPFMRILHREDPPPI